MDVLSLQWRELYAEDDHATPYQSPAWLIGWARQLPPTATPIVLAATRPTGRVVAALALARHDGTGRTRVLPLSAPHAEHIRPVGPHAEDPAVARALAFHLLLADDAGADILMTDVPATSALGQILPHLSKESGWDCAATASAAIQLPVHYNALPATVQSQHARRRRTWLHLAQTRTITYTRTRHTQDLLDAFDTLCDLHQERWEGRTLLPGRLNTSDHDMWQAVLRDLGAARASIASLAVNNTVIASQLLLTRRNHCYSLIPAIHPHYRHLAPGHALLRHLVDHLTDEGFNTLDLGRTSVPQKPYKRAYGPHWTDTVSARNTSLGAAVPL